ncbi:MAG: hypothetical protein A3C15_01405 [Candidatus Magasanikbacteria bacterium RIFCSPHIGHO2_02_FULL_50_9b]|uniref:Uncharacterized protein n=1 Tax=Candidatus Magasanikbacteria bacterium RIFCSPHIGHO2_02_FULL_50_9b TaxID=1798682 RepID=A0A1F6M7T5_9BACT|nr:MAG: hypothetical protein A3C15_01405 [Candidatus Magasanikbacteria bacterium RIFCSPHIGHO2_02_FULL_50_9b]
MKTSDSITLFFRTMAWSWFLFALVSVVIEFFRPSFVDSLIPLWLILLVAALSGMISVIDKRNV